MTRADGAADDLNFVLRDRRATLEALVAAGIAPYAYSFARTHDAAQAAAAMPAAAIPAEAGHAAADGQSDGPVVRLAGRVVSWRAHGKTTFGHLADQSGRIQLYFRADQLGPAYELTRYLDLGDVIGVTGPLFRTRTGEITVRVESAELLAKSLRPLPLGKSEVVNGVTVHHSGFADPEQRYRQRYADLAVHPEVRVVFLARARMISAVRRFLEGRGYLEVETPVLQPLYGGATARPFTTHHYALDMPLYLRIADELYLKRLIVGGFERVYEIGHDFRNEGIDRTHNPEFTMLEFYEAYADYRHMMDVVESLLVAAADAVRAIPAFADVVPAIAPPFPRLEWRGALATALGCDPLALDDAAIRNTAARIGVSHVTSHSPAKLLDEMFQTLVESKLDAPTFIVDYPVALSPLAKIKRGDPALTERFELFARGSELANAFSELNDPLEQRQRFEAQTRLRAGGDEEVQSLDADYLRALEYGMPPTGGVGIGIDRLLMYLTGTSHIRDVILFPAMRPEPGGEAAL